MYTDSPYKGITILDIDSGLSGAYASMLLGELGASVFRVTRTEASIGNPQSRLWNRGKQIVNLDPSVAETRSELEALVRKVDVTICTMTPGQAVDLGLDYDSLRVLNPKLVYCVISPFGETGPMANVCADDGVVAAYAGVYGEQGGIDAPPVFVHLPLPSYGAAFLAASVIGAALYVREATGQGQKVGTSLYAGALAMQAGTLVSGPGVRSWVRDQGAHTGQLGANPVYGLYQCSDDHWIMIACGTEIFWNKLCIALDRVEWIEDPRFDGAPWVVELEHRSTLRQSIEEIIATDTGEYWLRMFERYDVPRGLVKDRSDFPSHPQSVESGIFQSAEDSVLGKVTWMAPPIRIENSDLSSSDVVVANSNKDEYLPPHPLDGVKVIDLTGYIAGSYAASLLADFGAEVIKVESPMGDGFRMLGGSFQAWNRGKRGMVADLTTNQGRELLYEMVCASDLVVENFRPGTAARLGIDYQTLKEMRADLIYMSVNGYGTKGPLVTQPAFDPLVQALSGAMSAQGTEGTPVYLKVAITDYAAAMLACLGAVSALLSAKRYGGGRKVEVSLLNAAVAVQAGELIFNSSEPDEQRHWGQLGVSATYRIYQGADGFMFLSCSDEASFASACGILGLEHLPSIYPNAVLRRQGDLEIAQAFGTVIARHPVSATVQLLRTASVRCSEVRSRNELQKDRQAMANGLIVSGETPVGPLTQIGPPFSFSVTPPVSRRPGPSLGEHTDEILSSLGYSAERISELRRIGAVV